MNSRNRVADRHAIEARLGARLAGSLTVLAQTVPHDVGVRLRFAREQALVRARESRRATAVSVVGMSGAGTSRSGPSSRARAARGSASVSGR